MIDAINRQLAHFPHHVGQIIFLAKMIRKESWDTLSIAPGQSSQFNSSEGVKDPAQNFGK
ncbi:MAG: DUF1572 family protein [Chitinophagaceae bacterium]